MSQLTKRIIIKSPLIPLCQRGKPLSPPFSKVRWGGILQGNFQTAKVLPIIK